MVSSLPIFLFLICPDYDPLFVLSFFIQWCTRTFYEGGVLHFLFIPLEADAAWTGRDDLHTSVRPKLLFPCRWP